MLWPLTASPDRSSSSSSAQRGSRRPSKAVNDTYGHDGGDQVLVAAAEVLREAARLEDVPARIGGDEFALLLPECLEVGAKQVAAPVSENFVRITESLDMACSLSIGVSSTETTPAHRLLAAADEALYRSKATESPATTLAVSL